MKELKARGTFVIIKPDPKKEKSDGGILLAEMTKDEETDVRGQIISVGPGWHRQDGVLMPLDLKVGDKVFFHPGAAIRIFYKFEEESRIFNLEGKEVKKGGVETLFICKEHDCFSIIHED